MQIVHYTEIEPEPVTADNVKGTTIRWLISKAKGAPNFAMRFFEVEPDGFTPLHTHDWEHEVFIISGNGSVWKDGQEVEVTPGTAIFVPPMEKHQFKNTGNKTMQILCLIPAYAEK